MKRKIVLFMSVLSMILTFFTFPSAAAITKGATFFDYYSYSTQKKLTQMPYTMEAYVKQNEITSTAYSIFGNFRDTNTNSFSFRLQNGVPQVLLASLYDKGNYTVDFSKVAVGVNKWTHVSVTFNLETEKANCYIDGELKQTVALLPEQVEAIKTIDFVSDNKTHLTSLGTRHSSKGADSASRRDFKGEIGFFAAYSNTRTDAEIASDFKNYQNPDKNNLICAYNLNESGKPCYEDLSDNKNNLTWAARDFVNNEPEVENYDYSIAVVGDTQAISKISDTTAFYGLYDWITQNADSKKMKAVIGVGDITNNNTPEQWERAVTAFSKMKADVPFFNILGNHDNTDAYGGTVGIYKDYIKFNKTDSTDSFDNTIKTHYQKFKIGDTDWLILGLSCYPTEDEIKWAEEALIWHPFHNVILVTHSYLTAEGEINSGDDVPKIKSRLVDSFSNIVMVLCGHKRNDNVLLNTQTRTDGTTVHAVMANPQDADASVPGGVVTMLYFSENGKKVTTRNYVTAHDCYLGQNSSFTFELDLLENRKTEEESKETTSSETASFEETYSQDDTPAPEKKSSLPLIIGGGVAALIAAIVAVILIKKKK